MQEVRSMVSPQRLLNTGAIVCKILLQTGGAKQEGLNLLITKQHHKLFSICCSAIP